MILFTPNALKLIKELPDDKVLLLNIWKQLERIEKETERYTEPAVSPPFPEGRLMSNFQVTDGANSRWGITILVKLTDHEGGQVGDRKMTVTSLHAGLTDYLDDLLP